MMLEEFHLSDSEMESSRADPTLGSTRAGGHDDGSEHKLPQNMLAQHGETPLVAAAAVGERGGAARGAAVPEADRAVHAAARDPLAAGRHAEDLPATGG